MIVSLIMTLTLVDQVGVAGDSIPDNDMGCGLMFSPYGLWSDVLPKWAVF